MKDTVPPVLFVRFLISRVIAQFVIAGRSVCSSTRRLIKPFLPQACTIAFLISPSAQAVDYYVDPAIGNINNSGSSSAPWSTLQAVFTAGKIFAAGDIIYLRNGFHGSPSVTGLNSGNVTIRAQSGHIPKLKNLVVTNASRWVLSELNISPENAGVVDKTTRMVYVHSNCSYITIQRCAIYSAASIAGWTATDWSTKAADGFWTYGPNTTFTSNTLTNVNFGIVVVRTAKNSLISGNTIANIHWDGIRGLADDCTYSYNMVKNFFVPMAVESNHDDGFQSWSGGYDAIPAGGSQVKNVVLRGNTFISSTDPNQPLKSEMQGIGCFDGYFDNFVVENNLVITDMWHAIALFGARNCRIVNNTVMKHPINVFGYLPWITIKPHKNGVVSSNNIVRNNLSSDYNFTTGHGATLDHNIESTAYSTHYLNYTAFDARLKSNSTAIDAGANSLAPATDLELYSRSGVYDVGAFEVRGERLNDGFTDAGWTNGADSLDAAWALLNACPLSMVDESAGIGSGSALKLTPSAGWKGVVATFPTLVVADGRGITLTFNYRYLSSPANQSAGLRFGLYNTNATSIRTDDMGYGGHTNPGFAGGGATSIIRETSGTEILSGTDYIGVGSPGDSVVSGTTAHTAVLTIKRIGSTLSISTRIDGMNAAAYTDTSPLGGFTFNEVGITNGAVAGPAVAVDNVIVTF